MISCTDISLSFDKKEVFSDLTFSAEKGMHLCICGASGKGKSSILKILQGYVICPKGTISIDGHTISPKTINTIRKKIAWIPQNIHLPVENGNELLQLLDAKNKMETAEEKLLKLGLAESYLSKPFSEISGGQKQRIVIAVCLSLNREIILLDEPTASLDDEAIQLLISAINDEKDKTIISASHNQTWIESADKCITL